MFPVDRTKVHKFRVEGNPYYLLIKAILDKNEKQIIEECQKYLNDYEKGMRARF